MLLLTACRSAVGAREAGIIERRFQQTLVILGLYRCYIGDIGIMANKMETGIHEQCEGLWFEVIVAIWDAVGATVPYQYHLVKALP